MAIPRRLKKQSGRYSLVDGIPFHLPVYCKNSPCLMAAFSIDADKARALLPGNEIYPMRLWNKGVLVITVIDYRDTVIGKYIEYSIAIACTHGPRPAPRLLPALLMNNYGTGQYVYDLPVSSEISVKGGKGIWGMPKHQGNLDFVITDKTVSAQYDKDGQFAMKIEIDKPKSAWMPVSMAAVNYCQYRGLLMKSSLYFKTKLGFSFLKKGSARLTIGDHPRVRALKDLEINPDPIFTAFIPNANGVLDDHFEAWFLSFPEPPPVRPEGFESVIDLGLSEEWLPPPKPL
ncbi:MAG TPA: acetoacetate decarboxylase family protein [Pyrinomonadaceae bacterium]|nr:acetoacetate decarboxylase family protein [Pyrinomonadaceae bacterium]